MVSVETSDNSRSIAVTMKSSYGDDLFTISHAPVWPVLEVPDV